MVSNENQTTLDRLVNQGVHADIPGPNKIGASTPYDFEARNLTAYGGLLPVATMLENLGFQQLVEETVTVKRKTRAMPVFRFILGMVLACYVGFSRLNHLRFLKREPMLTGILRVAELPPQCTFWRFLASELKASTAAPVVEADHGCIETRTAMVSTEIDWLQKQYQWPGLKAIGKVVRMRETTDKTTTETAYYLLSRVLSPERLNQVARQHWGIENSLHWRVDVVMNEDQDRTRMGHGPHNLAVLRHMAINAMQKEGSKGSLRGKFKRAGWDDGYLYRLLELF
jgi:predicted transposase YbfD/YdcC